MCTEHRHKYVLASPAPDTPTSHTLHMFFLTHARTQIVSGHKYVLGLSGTGHKPNLNLSFTSFDFGPCALWQPGVAPTTKALKLTNTDTQPIAVDPQLAGVCMHSTDFINANDGIAGGIA